MTISDMSLQELLVHYWNKVLFGSSLKLVNAVSDILDRLEDFHSLAKEQEERHNIARFMAEIYRDLSSVLPYYQGSDRYGNKVGTDKERIKDVRDSIVQWFSASESDVFYSDLLLQIKDFREKITKSHCFTIAKMNLRRELSVVLGSDSYVGIRDAMRFGAATVLTSESILTAMTGDNPNYWLERRLEIAKEVKTEEEIHQLATFEYIARLAKLLYPIHKLNRKIGYVSYPLLPATPINAEKLVTEATAAWERLSEELPGRPNCVFNVPLGLEGTKAAEILLDMGIGINAHVYSTDQLEVFGDLTERYKNTQSFITLMTSWVDRFVDIELCPGKPSDIKVHCWPSVLMARRAFKDYWLGCNENFRYSETAFNLAAITDPAVLERNLFNEKAPIHISLTPKTREYYETEWDRVHKDFSNPSEEIEEALEKSKCFQELMGE